MLITFDEEKLRRKCEDVTLEEVDSLIETLEQEFAIIRKKDKSAIGLAAPQIGIYKKIAIIRLADENLNLVNCKIDRYYDSFTFKNEGCLSFPGKPQDTIRYNEIVVTNNLVEPHEFVATEFTAVAVQHELDHLNSTLISDRATVKQSPAKSTKVAPNGACPCGKLDPNTKTIKKYKKCCGKNV